MPPRSRQARPFWDNGRPARCQSPSRRDHLPELGEEILRIVRTGTEFGMVLHGERGKRLVADALNRAVVEVDVRHFQAVRQLFAHHGEIVVLARDLHIARREMVATVVPELEARVVLFRVPAVFAPQASESN